MEKQKQMLRQLSSNKLSQVLHTINNVASAANTIEHDIMIEETDSCAAVNLETKQFMAQTQQDPRSSYALLNGSKSAG